MRTYHTIRTFAALGLLVSMQALYGQPLGGTYIIDGTSNFSQNKFATIQEAFDSLNRRGASGWLTFTVNRDGIPPDWDPANEPPTITLAGYNCNMCDAVILSFAGVTIPTELAKAPAGTASQRFVIRLGGHTQSTLTTVNNPGQITSLSLVGSPYLVVKSTATGATTTGVIGLVSTTNAPLNVQNLTIYNFVVRGNGRSNTFAGIYVGPDASLTSGTPTGTVNGLYIMGNTIDSVSRPIHVRGVRPNFGNIIINDNSIGLASQTSWAATNEIGGIHVLGARYVTIARNVVTGASTYYRLAGVRLDDCEQFEISRNHIYGLKYTGSGGWGMYGIFVNFPSAFSLSGPTHRIENNMIADILGDAYGTSLIDVVGGIVVSAAASLSTPANLEIVHNSIHLFGTTNSNYATNGSAAIRVGSNVTNGVLIEGNILQNNLLITSGSSNKPAYGIWIDAPNPSFTINYNAYRVNPPGSNVPKHIGRVGTTNYTTFTAWQGAGYEANGVDLAIDVPFVSNTDLHIDPTVATQVINAGNGAYNGTADFDGQPRPIPSPGPGANGDPGTAPDIGADELDGTPLTCPTSLVAPNVITTTPPNAGTDYLWGTTIDLDTTGTNSPTASGFLSVIYSLDGGATWTAGPSVSGFPASFTLPANYTGTTISIALVANTIAGCPSLTPDTSDVPLVLNLTDRPGNRAINAIPLTLTPGPGGVWVAIVQDSTNGPGTTNEFNTATGARYGTSARDLYFRLTLPRCFDSLRVYTCEQSLTSYDTRIHVINATQPDTLSNEDAPNCPYSGGPSSWASRVIAIDALAKNSNRLLVRDSLPLRAGDDLYIVVEGFSSAEGRFQLTVEGYAPTLGTPNLGQDQTVCISQGTLTLSTPSVSGASTYEWVVDGNLVSGANTESYTLTLTVGTHEVIVRAIGPSHPRWSSACPPDTTADTVVVTVTPIPNTTVQVGSATTYDNGSTINISGTGTSVNATFTASSANTTPPVSYSWALFNPNNNSTTPDATGSGATFTHSFTDQGLYRLILTSDNGGCTERDTFPVNVSRTTALAAGSGTFRAYPNPSAGTFRVEVPVAGRYELRVLDAAGKLVHLQAMENTLSQEVRLSVPAGVYQLVVVGEGRREVIRLVVNP